MNLLQDIQRILREDGEDQDEPKKNLTADGESAIQQVLGRIFSVPSDSTRVVMLLNDADLKDRYLTGKGEAKITAKEATSDEQIAAIFSHAGFQVDGDVNPEDAFVFVTPSFDLAKIAKPISTQRPYAVLFNVPKSLAASLTTTKPTDIEDARKTLTEIIAHKNYVATLNVAAIKKAGVGALDDPHEREEQFNVRTMITAYPVRAVIDAARQEQADKDKNSKLTPGDEDGEEGDSKQPATLTKAQKDSIKKIAFAARQIFFAASAHGWPTTPEALKELRDNLVNALSKDSRIADPSWVPQIVKRFYSDIVKSDKNYQNLLELLKVDANFMKLAAGEEPEPDEEGGDEAVPTDGDATPAATGDTSTDKSAEELANEIKSKGQDYADEVAKILAGKKPTAEPAADAEATPAATDGAFPADLPVDVKNQAEKLQKMAKNAINPKTREKAASDLATLLHRHEESKKPKKAKAKK